MVVTFLTVNDVTNILVKYQFTYFTAKYLAAVGFPRYYILVTCFLALSIRVILIIFKILGLLGKVAPRRPSGL